MGPVRSASEYSMDGVWECVGICVGMCGKYVGIGVGIYGNVGIWCGNMWERVRMCGNVLERVGICGNVAWVVRSGREVRRESLAMWKMLIFEGYAYVYVRLRVCEGVSVCMYMCV